MLTIRDVINKRKKNGEEISDIDATWLKIQVQGCLNGKETMLGPYEGIENAWKNEPAFIVGGSFGLKKVMEEGFRFKMLDGYHSIGINHLIEDYDKFEWFMFQDARFLDNTTYDMNNYKGKVFVHCRAKAVNVPNKIVFYSQETVPTEKIIDGLYCHYSTGTLALSLAIIAGANPIYLLGCDNGGKIHSKQGAHYKENYPNEVKGHKNWKPKYINQLPVRCRKYFPYKDRIFNVDPVGDIHVFKKISFSDIPYFKKIKKETLDKTTICHIGTLPLEQMGSITRNIFFKTMGKHIYCNLLDNKVPEADIYILECFKKYNEKFKEFKVNKGKLISLIHSSEPCGPSKYSNEIVCLTKADAQRIKMVYNKNTVVIGGAIEVNRAIKANYESKKFGLIIRNDKSGDKFHPKFNETVIDILNTYSDAEFHIYSTSEKGLEKLKEHPRAFLHINEIAISEQNKKTDVLKDLSLAMYAHGDFLEIFPVAVLEAMSVGLPIVYLDQYSMSEMIGKSQVKCSSISELKDKVKDLLPNITEKRKLGRKAQIQAEYWNMGKMTTAWNDLFWKILIE